MQIHMYYLNVFKRNGALSTYRTGKAKLKKKHDKMFKIITNSIQFDSIQVILINILLHLLIHVWIS